MGQIQPTECSCLALTPTSIIQKTDRVMVFIWSLAIHILAQENLITGELVFFFTYMLMLWSSRHIAGRVWRRVIVPSNLAQSFCAMYAHNRYHVITNMWA